MKRRLVPAVALAAVAIAAAVVLRETTMSRHTSAPPGSSTVVSVTADAHRLTRSVSLGEATATLIARCRLEVQDESPLDTPVRRVDGDMFTFRLQPALDHSDRRQLKGCLEDILIDHVQLDVVAMRDEPALSPLLAPGRG